MDWVNYRRIKQIRQHLSGRWTSPDSCNCINTLLQSNETQGDQEASRCRHKSNHLILHDTLYTVNVDFSLSLYFFSCIDNIHKNTQTIPSLPPNNHFPDPISPLFPSLFVHLQSSSFFVLLNVDLLWLASVGTQRSIWADTLLFTSHLPRLVLEVLLALVLTHRWNSSIHTLLK